jgi:hypothetical protein
MPTDFVTSRAKFPADTDPKADAISWDRFPDRRPIDFGGRPALPGTTDRFENAYELTIRSGHLAGRRQDGGPSWAGSFADGEALLFTDFSPGPLEFTFRDPIRGAGVQINVKDSVEHANVGIAAFGADGKHLAGGTSLAFFSNRGDGSAPFVGVLGRAPSTRNVLRIIFFITVLDPGYRGDSSFAINAVRLAT